jgi:hypothetical protein
MKGLVFWFFSAMLLGAIFAPKLSIERALVFNESL